ncbi:hypothetical protein HaLaN_20690 [Haematococcus lacustris]|uniref:Uncharacterized protein n=1 Tax=Haematococcus lacustris TaxID=44745 RepID=A0A699ZK26_HAELA|nr:hypothetical protein HaLaN_20690 [Haematococcus lacustris]
MAAMLYSQHCKHRALSAGRERASSCQIPDRGGVVPPLGAGIVPHESKIRRDGPSQAITSQMPVPSA